MLELKSDIMKKYLYRFKKKPTDSYNTASVGAIGFIRKNDGTIYRIREYFLYLSMVLIDVVLRQSMAHVFYIYVEIRDKELNKILKLCLSFFERGRGGPL